MRILIPSQLRSYTLGHGEVTAQGKTVDEALKALNKEYPGLRFRMVDEQDQVRPHIKVFLNRRQVMDLKEKVNPEDELMIVGALSGG